MFITRWHHAIKWCVVISRILTFKQSAVDDVISLLRGLHTLNAFQLIAVDSRRRLKFARALAETISVVAYAEFENVIEVDRDRNVILTVVICVQ